MRLRITWIIRHAPRNAKMTLVPCSKLRAFIGHMGTEPLHPRTGFNPDPVYFNDASVSQSCRESSVPARMVGL